MARGWIVANIWGGVLGSDAGSDVSDDDGDSAGVDVDEAKRFGKAVVYCSVCVAYSTANHAILDLLSACEELKQLKRKETYHVEIEVILEQVQAFDNVLVAYVAQQHHLGRESANLFIFRPSVIWNFLFNDELDRDLMPLDTVIGRHDEAIPARAQFIF